jgi:hypothetical protein
MCLWFAVLKFWIQAIGIYSYDTAIACGEGPIAVFQDQVWWSQDYGAFEAGWEEFFVRDPILIAVGRRLWLSVAGEFEFRYVVVSQD